MRFQVVVALIVSLWAASALYATQAGQAAPAGTTTWSGVYTEEQSKLGKTAYVKYCAECHGEDLGGDGFAPPLKGPEFLSNWSGLTVGELFDRIRISMPPTNPNDVSVKEKVEIVAYVLEEDGFPAGTIELPDTIDALKTIKIEASKPGRR
ncbi:MAG TPA: cytochrome c [Vicinamibacterales bacterium]|nr:cytochrome c [Vicinamibacterales bacterium]